MVLTESGTGNARASGAQAGDKAFKLYVALGYVPPAMFAFFILAAYIAFALPVATYSSVNSGVAFDSPGNIYTAAASLLDFDGHKYWTNYNGHIYNCIIALYIVIGLATAYGIFTLIMCLKGKYCKRNPESRIGATFAGCVSSGFYILYIVFATLAATIIVRVNILDDGNNVLVLGAAPVVLLAAEGVAIVASVVSVVMRYRMELKHENFREAEQQANGKKHGERKNEKN